MIWEDFCSFNGIGKAYNQPRDQRLNKKLYEGADQWLRDPSSSVLLMGNCGTGKTFMLIYLLREIARRVGLCETRYFKSQRLDERLLSDFEEYGSNSHFLNTLSEVKFLFIDDLGCERDSERVRREYYDIIDNRLQNERPTIISTNLDEQKIDERYGDRITSRFQEYTILEFTGKDLRRR